MLLWFLIRMPFWDLEAASCGIYLLTCPRTKDSTSDQRQVPRDCTAGGSPTPETAMGENVGLKSRDPSDYQVSILEVVACLLTTPSHGAPSWSSCGRELQSREMGLNRN